VFLKAAKVIFLSHHRTNAMDQKKCGKSPAGCLPQRKAPAGGDGWPGVK
jgi:hypothetical protein